MEETYILHSSKEANRLEKQIKQKNYSLEEDLRYFDIPFGASILDAGCGTGLVSRYIAQKFKAKKPQIYGCDFSSHRLSEAQKACEDLGESIDYKKAELSDLSYKDETFDMVVSRYVFQHLPENPKAIFELKRVLKKGGQIYLIDIDGIFVNIYTKNQELNEMADFIKDKIPVCDVFVGRKLPSILSQAGFQDISWNMTVHPFQGEELLMEYEHSKTRFEIIGQSLCEVFKSKQKAKRFEELYLKEMLYPETVLFHNKIIVTAKKSLQ